ncbi:MAG: ATP-binding protein [Sphaerochaetaceae bacterium]
MNKFVRRAFNKIEKLSTDEIKTLVRYQASENELLGNALENIDTGVIVINSRLRVLSCNNVAKRYLPLKRKMTEGSTLQYVIADDDVIKFINTSLDNINDREKVEKEFYFQRGERVHTIIVEISSFTSELEAVFSLDNKKRFLILVHDVTNLKQQEARLHRSESLASLTTVAAGVAHEIKNPLASIDIHLQLLRKAFERKEKLSLEESSRYLDVIDEEINRLNAIVVDFLFAVRPMDVRLRLESLNRIVEEVLNFVTYELSENGIEIKKNLDEYLPKLRLDENLIKQALLNIIKNSQSAMSRRGGILTVTTKQEGDLVVLSVKDSGKGMDSETLSKIFEPYFTTKSTGSGLGLTMVFKEVKEHNGEISVISKVNEGATFSISLPIPVTERLALE